MKNYVGINELSILLNICKTTLYSRMTEKKEIQKENKNLHSRENFNQIYYKEDGNSYKVDIDKLLNTHKMFDFEFINELEGKSFLERVQQVEIIRITDLPLYLKTTNVEYFFDLTRTKLDTLRKKNTVHYKIIEDTRYPPNSKNRKRYLYEKISLINYAIEKNIFIRKKEIITYNYKKEFYTPLEIVQYLKEQYNFSTSIMTIHRRIKQKKIPCIRIYDLKKIPILEFEQLDHYEIFNIK